MNERYSPNLKRILITGGLGRIGTVLCRELKGRYITRSYDLRPQEEADENYIGNITDAEALADACADVSAVVHLARDTRRRRPSTCSSTRTYAEPTASMKRRGGRASQRSSSPAPNHVSGMWEEGWSLCDAPICLSAPTRSTPSVRRRGEATARFFADKHGIASVCLRIGGFSPQKTNRAASAAFICYARTATWGSWSTRRFRPTSCLRL